MSEVKWIKIVVGIFDDEKIKLIEALPSSDTIIVIWFKLLCLAGQMNCGGVLIMNDRIAYTDEMLAAIFRRPINDVRLALETFVRYGMIEIIDDVYVIPNWGKYQSRDKLENMQEKHRERQRKYREKQRLEIEKKRECVTSDVTRDGICSISYSFSKSLNVNNYHYVIENNIHSESLYITNNSRLYKAIEEWMEYKDNKKPKSSNHYDTEKGVCKLLTSIVNHDRQYGTDKVIEAIDNTIANNYQGIVWDTIERNANKKPVFDGKAWASK